MKFAAKTFIAFTLACTLGASAAFAVDRTPTPSGKALTPQQQKMSDCNQTAKAQSLKGPEYKTFMSECLKKDSGATPVAAKPAAAATAAATPATAAAPAPAAATPAVTQQQKMKACNADPQAKTLKGDDRKKFMSTCLSAPAATPAAAH